MNEEKREPKGGGGAAAKREEGEGEYREMGVDREEKGNRVGRKDAQRGKSGGKVIEKRGRGVNMQSETGKCLLTM